MINQKKKKEKEKKILKEKRMKMKKKIKNKKIKKKKMKKKEKKKIMDIIIEKLIMEAEIKIECVVNVLKSVIMDAKSSKIYIALFIIKPIVTIAKFVDAI